MGQGGRWKDSVRAAPTPPRTPVMPSVLHILTTDSTVLCMHMLLA